jgi:hypothetical protein
MYLIKKIDKTFKIIINLIKSGVSAFVKSTWRDINRFLLILRDWINMIDEDTKMSN